MRFFKRRSEARAMDVSAFMTGTDMTSSPVYRGGKKSVSRALSLAPVYASTRILADDTASLPLQCFRKRPDGTREDAELPGLFQKPAAEGTVYDWVFQAVASLTLTGNTTGVATGFDRLGLPTGIEWLHPEMVEITKVNGRWEWFFNGVRLDRAEVVHIAGYTLPGSPVGLSPIAAFALSMDTSLFASAFASDWFRNGSTPSAVLESDQAINQDQANTLKERFKQAAKGRDVVAMGLGTKYRPISVPAGESQFLESIKASATQIANIYGLRPERIGGETGNSLTYANVEQNSINDAAALRPWVSRLEAKFKQLVKPGDYVRFNLDAIIRADLKTRYEAHAIALDKKFLTVDEVRALEDRQPMVRTDGGTKNYQDVGLPALVQAGIVSPAWAAEQVGAPTAGLSSTPKAWEVPQ